jgi:hypothetical protein
MAVKSLGELGIPSSSSNRPGKVKSLAELGIWPLNSSSVQSSSSTQKAVTKADSQPQSQESLATRGAKAVSRTAKSLGSGVAGSLADTVTGIINLLSSAINGGPFLQDSFLT